MLLASPLGSRRAITEYTPAIAKNVDIYMPLSFKNQKTKSDKRMASAQICHAFLPSSSAVTL